MRSTRRVLKKCRVLKKSKKYYLKKPRNTKKTKCIKRNGGDGKDDKIKEIIQMQSNAQIQNHNDLLRFEFTNVSKNGYGRLVVIRKDNDTVEYKINLYNNNANINIIDDTTKMYIPTKTEINDLIEKPIKTIIYQKFINESHYYIQNRANSTKEYYIYRSNTIVKLGKLLKTKRSWGWGKEGGVERRFFEYTYTFENEKIICPLANTSTKQDPLKEDFGTIDRKKNDKYVLADGIYVKKDETDFDDNEKIILNIPDMTEEYKNLREHPEWWGLRGISTLKKAKTYCTDKDYTIQSTSNTGKCLTSSKTVRCYGNDIYDDGINLNKRLLKNEQGEITSLGEVTEQQNCKDITMGIIRTGKNVLTTGKAIIESAIINR